MREGIIGFPLPSIYVQDVSWRWHFSESVGSTCENDKLVAKICEREGINFIFCSWDRLQITNLRIFAHDSRYFKAFFDISDANDSFIADLNGFSPREIKIFFRNHLTPQIFVSKDDKNSIFPSKIFCSEKAFIYWGSEGPLTAVHPKVVHKAVQCLEG